MAKLQPGQTVYILGRYRAVVVECSPFTVTCDVYEGLAPHEKCPLKANYPHILVEAQRTRAIRLGPKNRSIILLPPKREYVADRQPAVHGDEG